MLKFKNVNLVFAFLLGCCIAAEVKFGISVLIYPLLIVAYSLILFYGCYFIGSNFFVNVITSLKTKEKKIALTFDDGPDKKKTSEILQLLLENDVKAAFFCIGENMAGNELLVKQIHNEGHIIGNHTFSHSFWFDMLTSKNMLEDMRTMNDTTEKIIGKIPKFFRPPYGVTNPPLAKAILSGKFIAIGWNVRSMDTVIKNEDKLLKKLIHSLKPGCIYLFHDTGFATLSILPDFLKQVKTKGYHIERLDQFLKIPAYA